MITDAAGFPYPTSLFSLFSPVRGYCCQTLFMGWDRRKNKPGRSANGAMSPAVDQMIVWGRTRNHCRSQDTSSLISSLNHIMHRRALPWPGNLTERCISHLQPYAIIVCTTQKVPGVRYSVLQSPYIRNDGRKPLRYATSFLWSERQVNEAE